MKVAVVHDWLDTWRGGESVLAEILRIYPNASLFALVDFMNETDRRRLGDRPVQTSFIARLPFARSHFRMYLPLFPRAVESLDVSAFDLVISSSHAFAKGVRIAAGQLHVCYCYTPMRYAWDLQTQYLRQTGLDTGARGLAARALLGRLRAWDRSTSGRVARFIAVSEHIAARIKAAYGREATVIHPPVAIPAPMPSHARGDGYVTVSALVPYKRVDLLVDAFRTLPARSLTVVGDGPERERLQRGAPSNVRFLGRLPDRARDAEMARARAFVFAAEEDFGIAPLEAQALGLPVIACSRGAARETIHGLEAEHPTGVLFAEQTAEAVAAAILAFEASAARIDPEHCRENAARFAPQRFREAFRATIDQCVRAHPDAGHRAVRLPTAGRPAP